MQFPCIECNLEVRPRQHAVACESCDRWQHRTCKTGWHHRLNRQAGSQSLSFYRLIPALRSEAELVSYELGLVREGVSTRRIRPVYRDVERKIEQLWDRYTDDNISTSELLKKCAKIYGPQCEFSSVVEQETVVTRL